MNENKENNMERRKEDALRYIADDLLKDRRNQRRLAYVKTGFFAVLFGLVMLVNLLGINPFSKGVAIPKGEKYVAMVRISGQINPSSPGSAEVVEKQISRAFSDKQSEGVLLVVNSPGGTAVQGLMLKNMIDEYKSVFGKRVVVFGEDILASGAYMASMSADKIYVTPSTITGSIGVIQQHFGATQLMDKLGVDARTIYSGEHKNRMSMYAPLIKGDEKKMSETTAKIHQHFIELVKQSRGEKLIGEDSVIFSGDFWVGTDAAKMGLVDGVSTLSEAIQQEFGTRYKVDYTERSPVSGLRKMMSLASVLSSGYQPDVLWKASLPQ